jgi:vacuolar-type H+-ATPase subunit E/Vma4
MELFRTLKRIASELKKERGAEMLGVIKSIVEQAVRDEFAKLPEDKRVELISTIIKSKDITVELLKKFVEACPDNKYVEVDFSTGDRILITGKASERRGPGW